MELRPKRAHVARIPGRLRHRRVYAALVNQFSPFLVVEEERFIPVFVVDLAESHWSSGVESEYVQAQFLRRQPGLVAEEVVGVECIVPDKLPSAGVEVLCAGLEYHADRS